MQTGGSVRSRWLWRLLPLGIVVLVAGAILVSRQLALAAPTQPIAFTHQKHNQAGVPCLFCHPGALRSAEAGLPSLQKCMGCHSVIAVVRPEIKKVAGYWDRQEPIPWVRVNVQPDFVYFSHQPHLGAGLNCETCHGDVGNMTVAAPVVKMDMGWCLDCHLKQPEEKVGRLTDCLTCHE